MGYKCVEDWYRTREGDVTVLQGDLIEHAEHLGDSPFAFGRNRRSGCWGFFPLRCVDLSTSEPPSADIILVTTADDVSGPPVTGRAAEVNPFTFPAHDRLTPTKAKKVSEASVTWTDSGVSDNESPEKPAIARVHKSHSLQKKLHNKRIRQLVERTPDSSDTESRGDSPVIRSLKRHASSAGSITHSLANQLSTSSYRDDPRTVAAFSLLMSTLTGVVVLGSSAANSNISRWAALAISGAFFAASLLLLVLSRRARAVYAVMLPNLCATRGQTVIMSVAFALLFHGPLQAILYNTDQIATSLLCHSELAANQSAEVAALHARPVHAMMSHLHSSQDAVARLNDALASPVATAVQALQEAGQQMRAVEAQLEGANARCVAKMTRMNRTCDLLTSDVGTFCDTISRAAQQHLISGWETLIDGSSSSGERPDHISECDGASQATGAISSEDCEEREESKRRSPVGFCETIEWETLNVCNGSADIFSVAGCRSMAGSAGVAGSAASATDHLQRVIADSFSLSIVVTDQYNGTFNQSSSAEQLRADVLEALHATLPYLEVSSLVLSYWMALFFLTLIMKSYLYVSSFIKDDAFDNHYLTDELKRRLVRKGLYPLRRSERRSLVRTWQLAATSKERRRVLVSVYTSAIYTSAAASILLVNWFLYWLLATIEQYGQSETQFASDIQLQFSIQGSGVLRDIAQFFLQEFVFSENSTLLSDNRECLPHPKATENATATYCTLAFLFSLFYLTIFTQTFVLRLRPVICGLFYRERRQARADWLACDVISRCNSRRTLIDSNIRTSKLEVQRRDAMMSLGWACRVQEWLLPLHGFCFACREGGFGRHVRCTCTQVVYCRWCLAELDNRCFSCKSYILQPKYTLHTSVDC